MHVWVSIITWKTFWQICSIIQLPVRASTNPIFSAIDRDLSRYFTFRLRRIENKADVASKTSQRIDGP